MTKASDSDCNRITPDYEWRFVWDYWSVFTVPNNYTRVHVRFRKYPTANDPNAKSPIVAGSGTGSRTVKV